MLAALATRSWAQHFSPEEKEALEELRQAGLLESDIDELLALEEDISRSDDSIPDNDYEELDEAEERADMAESALAKMRTKVNSY